jgi:cytochrome b561
MTKVDIGQRTKVEHRREVSLVLPPDGGGAQFFDPIVRGAHWLTLFLMICLFSTAALAEAGLPDPAKLIVIQLHRSFGLTLWAVTVLRLIWRQFAQFPDWPANLPRRLRMAASAAEYLLYSLLLLQPILGLLYTNARGNVVHFYLLVRIPPLIAQHKELGEKLIAAHAFVASALLIVIAMHASMMVYRHFVRRENTLNRMLPEALRSQARQEWPL